MRRPALIAALSLLLPLLAHAQLLIPGADNALSISASPQYPTPGSSVILSVDSSFYDLSQATITWQVNGKTVDSGENLRTETVAVGGLGSQTRVSVFSRGPDGNASASITLVPASIDLLWEADTYVPPFYLGRALPSADARIRLQAVPHLVRSNGSSVPADQITYTWKKDGAPVAASSGRGKSSAILPGPVLYGSETLSVEAVSSDKTLAGAASVTLSSIDPELRMYEDHPIFGILYERALGSVSSIPESEMSFSAVPYYAPVRSTADPALTYNWQVNGSAVAPNAATPNEITIDARQSSGDAEVALEVTHASNFYFDARGSWSMKFSSNTGSAGSPFAPR